MRSQSECIYIKTLSCRLGKKFRRRATGIVVLLARSHSTRARARTVSNSRASAVPASANGVPLVITSTTRHAAYNDLKYIVVHRVHQRTARTPSYQIQHGRGRIFGRYMVEYKGKCKGSYTCYARMLWYETLLTELL